MPKKKADQETGLLTICFNDGTVHVFNPSELPETQQANLLLAGLSHTLGDTWAGKADDAYENCMGRWEALTEDRWTQRGENTPRTSILLRALMMIDSSLEESTIREQLQSMDKDKRKSIERNPAVAEKMAIVKAEDAAKRAEDAKEKAAKAPPVDIQSLLG